MIGLATPRNLGRRRTRRVGGPPTAPASADDHHAGHRRDGRRPDTLSDGPGGVQRRDRAGASHRHVVAGRGRARSASTSTKRGPARLPPLQREADRRRRAERQRVLPDPVADRRCHLLGQRRRHRRRRRDDRALLRHRRQPGVGTRPHRLGRQRRERSALLERVRPRARRLLRLRGRHRRLRQLAGPLLDRSGARERDDSGRHGQQRQRPARRLGDQVRRVEPGRGRGRRRRHQPAEYPGRHAPAPLEHLDAAGRRDRLLRRAHCAGQSGFDARRRHAHVPAAGAGPPIARLLAAAVRAHDRRRQRDRRPRDQRTSRP